MGNYYNYDRRKKKISFFIKIIFLLLIIVFIYGCYNFSFLRDNKYIKSARTSIENAIKSISNNAKNSFSALVENYEPNEEDYAVYEITDAQNRYYYNQLDEPSKIIYAEILGNLDKIKNGEDNIKISSKLSDYISAENGANSLVSSFQNAWDAFRNDNVDVFYVDGSKMCLITKTIKKGSKTYYEFYIGKGDNQSYFIDSLNSAQDVNYAIAYVSDKEKEILDSINDKNDYYKILKAHNWIVDNVSYNLDDASNNSNIYGALQDKKVVCEGYARLFKSLMDKLDIPCVLVSGTGEDRSTNTRENHAWNYVYLKGNWYAIDVTWDDPIIIGNGYVNNDVRYKYFLKGSDEFFKTHKEEGRLVENGMTFTYPVLSEEDYIKDE